MIASPLRLALGAVAVIATSLGAAACGAPTHDDAWNTGHSLCVTAVGAGDQPVDCNYFAAQYDQAYNGCKEGMTALGLGGDCNQTARSLVFAEAWQDNGQPAAGYQIAGSGSPSDSASSTTTAP